MQNWKTQLIGHQLGLGWQSQQVAGIGAEAAGGPSVDDNCVVVVVEEELNECESAYSGQFRMTRSTSLRSYCPCFDWKEFLLSALILLFASSFFIFDATAGQR